MAAEHTYLEIEGRPVPAKIYREFRGSVRASIGKKAVILRMPKLLPPWEQRKQLKWFADWVAGQFEKNTHIRSRFWGKTYQDGDIVEVGDRQYLLKIELCDRKTHSARLRNGVIHFRLNKEVAWHESQKGIRKLLSRVVGQDFLPDITRRVHWLNQLHFQKSIKKVSLKNNQSNWGSCSVNNNINLSTRLLFAPPSVIDYVIIHELAHLTEMNHSKKFWALVQKAMPDYKEKEKWLRDNDHLCNF